MRIVRAVAILAQLLYPTTPPGAVTTLRDLAYAGDRRVMDVYRPENRASASARPALVVFTAFSTSQRRELQPVGWAIAAAANGIVGVVPDVRPDHAAEDVDAVLAYLATHSAELDVDPQAVALIAYSGNVQSALPLVEDPRRTGVHAAVMLYGAGDIARFRRDLPVLLVRAGLDRPGVNRDVAALADAAMAQNAPVTILNQATGHHGFDVVDDDDATRSAIDAVLSFVKRATAAGYRDAVRRGAREATAAGAFMTGDFATAAAAFRELVNERPADARLRLSYGEALLANRQYREACDAFADLKTAALGARDRGIPAARACALAADATAAVAWLHTIPKRFLPPELEHDAAFASLRGREDFRALFRP